MIASGCFMARRPQLCLSALAYLQYGTGSGTVVMQAPDGTIQAVPVAEVAHYASRGAQVLQ
jgi:hypothetical protein